MQWSSMMAKAKKYSPRKEQTAEAVSSVSDTPAQATIAPELHHSQHPLLNFHHDRFFWGIFLLAVLMRLPTLTLPGMWFDEIRTMNVAENELFRPGLGHMLFYTISRFMYENIPGPADFTLRLFPLICGLISIPLLYEIGSLLKDRTLGRWCALLATLSYSHLFFSQEARFYTPMFLVAALTWWCSLRAFRHGNFTWLILALFFALSGYWLHPTQAVLMAAYVAWLVLSLGFSLRGRRLARHWFWPMHHHKARIWPVIRLSAIVIMLIAALTKTAFLVRFVKQWVSFSPEQAGTHADLNPLLDIFREYGGQYAFTGSIMSFWSWAFLGIIALGMVVAWKRWRRDMLLVLLLSAATILAVYLKRTDKVFEAKYAYFLYPFWLALAGTGFVWLGERMDALSPKGKRRLGQAMLVIVVGLMHLPALWHYYANGKIEEKKALRWISEQWQEGDVVVTYGHSMLPVRFYWQKWELPEERYRPIRWNEKDNGQWLIDRINILREQGRVWFIDSWPADDPERLAPWLAQQGEPTKTWASNMTPVDVYRLDPLAPPKQFPIVRQATQTLPTRYPRMPYADVINDRQALVLDTNSELKYPFDVDVAGIYYLKIDAVHDIARVPIFTIYVNDELQAAVSYLRQNGEWGIKSVPLTLQAGRNVVTLHWIGDGLITDSDRTLPIRAVLGELSLDKTPLSPVNDDILDLLDFQTPWVEEMPLFDPVDPLKANPGWTLNGETTLSAYPKTSDSPAQLCIEVPHNLPDKGGAALLWNEPFPLIDSDFVYLTAKLRTDDCYNYSVNVMALFLDEEDNIVKKLFMQRIGLDNDLRMGRFSDEGKLDQWTTVGGVLRVPSDCVTWSPAIVIYEKGRQQSRTDGKAWISEIRLAP